VQWEEGIPKNGLIVEKSCESAGKESKCTIAIQSNLEPVVE